MRVFSDRAAPSELRVLAVLCTLLAFASISTDLYLPALPTMTQALHAPTGQLEWTISGYLIGFSIGQLLWGPVSDRYGRRGPVALLFIYVSATGLIVANAIIGTLSRAPARTGSASALIGAVQYGAGIFGSALIGLFSDGTPGPMGWVMAVSGVGSAICACWLLPAPSRR